MNITLRLNQTEPISKAIKFFNKEESKPSIIVLPTAWGKSILTAFVAKETDGNLLILQPTKELLEQNYAKYVNLCEFETNAGIYSASFGKSEICKITYATIGSIKNLGAKFRDLGFTKLLIDECHLYPRETDSMFGTFLRDSGITHVLGITATPIKLQQNIDLHGNRFSKLVMLTNRSKKGNFYKNIIHVGEVSEMIELGYWSKLKYMSQQFNSNKLVFNSTKAEYTEDSILESFEANNIRQKIIDTLDNNRDRNHILVFVPSVESAISLSEIYPHSGVIYGDMPKKDRSNVISMFRAGDIRVIFNVRVLSTGFDYTGIDCIVLGITTASIALYYQIIGRATRIDPDKKDALIIDLGGNVERFGIVEHITYKKGTQWQMYGTNGIQLSGVPIHEIGAKEEVLDIMPFGKYKDKRIADIPKDYKKWLLGNISWDKSNAKIKKAIELTLKEKED